jgi:hypothetical protein
MGLCVAEVLLDAAMILVPRAKPLTVVRHCFSLLEATLGPAN